jgi:hypothetical protein
MSLNRKEAIAKIHEIQTSFGLDVSLYPKIMCGSIAREYWEDSIFSLGMEYGYIYALLQIFDIEPFELH